MPRKDVDGAGEFMHAQGDGKINTGQSGTNEQDIFFL